MRLAMIVMIAMAMLDTTSAAESVKPGVELNSERIGVLGLPLAESTKPVHWIGLTAKVDGKGEGSGVVTLDLTELPAYDEFGFPTTVAAVPAIKLDCSLRFVKKTVRVSTYQRLEAPEREKREAEVKWRLYAVTGPKITSRLFLATATVNRWREGRLLVQGEDGKVKYAVDLRMPPLPEPCHPGCFPAGTPIATPGGTEVVDGLRPGDAVTTVGPDGTSGEGKVASVFITRNRLIEVRTGARWSRPRRSRSHSPAAGSGRPAI